MRTFGGAPRYAANRHQFAQLKVDLRRGRYNALLGVAGLCDHNLGLENIVKSLTIDISLWHSYEPDAGQQWSAPKLTPAKREESDGWHSNLHKKVHGSGFFPSHAAEVSNAFARFEHVRHVEIVTNNLPHPCNNQQNPSPSILLESSPESVFLNMLDALSQLPNPMETLSIRTGRNTPLSVRLFTAHEHVHRFLNLNDTKRYRARTRQLKLKVLRCINAMSKLKSFEVVLFDAAIFSRWLDHNLERSWLPTALTTMSGTLEHLRLDFTSPEYRVTAESSVDLHLCSSHRAMEDNRYMAPWSPTVRIDWSILELDRVWHRLEALTVKNVPYRAEDLGGFLSKNPRVKEVTVDNWSCEPSLPTHNFLLAVLNFVGRDSLKRVTFKQSFNTHDQLCYALDAPYRGVLVKPMRYWTITAFELYEAYSVRRWTPAEVLENMTYTAALRVDSAGVNEDVVVVNDNASELARHTPRYMVVDEHLSAKKTAELGLKIKELTHKIEASIRDSEEAVKRLRELHTKTLLL